MNKFDIALEALIQAGKDLNSAYYMEGYDKKYVDTGLWELIKEAESIGDKIVMKTITENDHTLTLDK